MRLWIKNWTFKISYVMITQHLFIQKANSSAKFLCFLLICCQLILDHDLAGAICQYRFC